MKVIVTGASKGIGKGIATVLAREGYTVGLVARSPDLLMAVQKTIESAGGRCVHAVCDLRDPEAAHQAMEHLISRMGGIDALINNAGLVIRKDVFTLTLDEWRALVDTNISGLFYATRAVLPRMKAQNRGHIINISSISGRVPLAGGSAYAATKYAVTGFSESLLLEVRQYGIKVTTVYPGSVDSGPPRPGSAEDHSWKVQPAEIGSACLNILKTSANTLISALEIRPLQPPGKK